MDVQHLGRPVPVGIPGSLQDLLPADHPAGVEGKAFQERAWDAHWYGPTKVLDVHVAALRRKLGMPGLIEAAYGKGFRLGGQ